MYTTRNTQQQRYTTILEGIPKDGLRYLSKDETKRLQNKCVNLWIALSRICDIATAAPSHSFQAIL